MSSISIPTALSGDADFVVRVDTSAVLSQSLVTDLNGLADRAEDADPGAVVVHLAGGAAPVGDPAWPGAIGVHQVNRWEQALRRIERLSAVTIAVVTGRCGGAALDLLLSCDYRIAAPDASLALPVSSGSGQVWPGMAIHRMTTQLGVRRARRLVMFPGELPAADALELGLLDEIAADPAAAAAAKVAAASGLAGAEAAIRRRLLLDAATTSFEEALGAHLAACDRTLRKESGESVR